jgi:hypothetical protein
LQVLRVSQQDAKRRGASLLPEWARTEPNLRAPRANPPTVTLAEIALGALGATALAGGAEMWVYPHGNPYIPGTWLDRVPVLRSWRLPGLVLAGVFGTGSLVTLYGLGQRPRWRIMRPVERRTGQQWPWAATCAIGTSLVAWIGAEVVLIPKRHPIEGYLAGGGALLVGLAATPSFRRALALGTGEDLIEETTEDWADVWPEDWMDDGEPDAPSDIDD